MRRLYRGKKSQIKKLIPEILLGRQHMEGSRERSSGQPIARAEEIPTAIDEVLNRIKVTLFS